MILDDLHFILYHFHQTHSGPFISIPQITQQCHFRTFTLLFILFRALFSQIHPWPAFYLTEDLLQCQLSERPFWAMLSKIIIPSLLPASLSLYIFILSIVFIFNHIKCYIQYLSVFTTKGKAPWSKIFYFFS
jgi:hypothetical protein